MVAQEEALCIDGTLLFREDFGGNDPSDPDMSMASVQGMSSLYSNSGNNLGSGHYTIRKEGWNNGYQWHRQDDHTYFGDKTRGYLLEIDGLGGAVPFYSKTIDGLCEGYKLTFSAYAVNVHYAGQIDWLVEKGRGYVYPRLKFVLKNSATGGVIAEKSTGDIHPDYTKAWDISLKESADWQLIGMNFTVPEGVESIQMFIYNDVPGDGNGNDFALDDIEIHLCLPTPEINGETEVCTGSAVSLTAAFTNDGTMLEPLEYKWWRSTDSIIWTEMSSTTSTCALSSIQRADSGWYQVAVSGAGNIESVNCRAVSKPFRIKIEECDPCPDVIIEQVDTTVCDTLMPFTWRGVVFDKPSEQHIMEKSARGCDSIEHIYTLQITHCPYPAVTYKTDTVVCHSSLPFTWQGMAISGEGLWTETIQDRWGVDSVYYVLQVDTMNCDQLWPIIVNKYNWQLICDNVVLRKLLPERTPTAFQWYKNDQLINGATEDEYAEQNELHGVFQLKVTLDKGQTIWSNILTILETPDEQPLRVQVYNSQGLGISEERAKHGIFLLRYEQGDRVWTEKRLIP